MIGPSSAKGTTPNRRYRHVHVVARIDDGMGDPVDHVSLTKAYSDPTDANLEAARLNALNGGRGCRYVVMVARFVEGQPEPKGSSPESEE